MRSLAVSFRLVPLLAAIGSEASAIDPVLLQYDPVVSVIDDKTAEAYGPDHWKDENFDGDAKDEGEHRFPVIFVRNTNVEISKVVFRVTSQEAAALGAALEIRVLGMGPDEDDYGAEASFTSEGLVAGPMLSDDPLPDSVKFYNTYDIGWSIAFDYPGLEEGGPPVTTYYWPAGITDNRMYVPLVSPAGNTGPSGPLEPFETVCETSCGTAEGATSATLAQVLIWGYFATRTMSTKPLNGKNEQDNRGLGFWLTENPQSELDAFMANESLPQKADGDCYAWATFLYQTWLLQGAQSTIYHLTMNQTQNPLAKLFRTGVTTASGSSYSQVGNQSNQMVGRYPHSRANLTQVELPGQRNPNPGYVWGTHRVCMSQGFVFDPSFGTYAQSQSEYENLHLSAVSCDVHPDNNYPGNGYYVENDQLPNPWPRGDAWAGQSENNLDLNWSAVSG